MARAEMVPRRTPSSCPRCPLLPAAWTQARGREPGWPRTHPRVSVSPSWVSPARLSSVGSRRVPSGAPREFLSPAGSRSSANGLGGASGGVLLPSSAGESGGAHLSTRTTSEGSAGRGGRTGVAGVSAAAFKRGSSLLSSSIKLPRARGCSGEKKKKIMSELTKCLGTTA